ncbi:hypothetical protein COO60DRAFT_713027 [Scenedesmus sp. NREL 46B-D3]|nr:hypothetical protein COO60DRAFT_713027 [Scenedesmus sp. NREL 46B-D3]
MPHMLQRYCKQTHLLCAGTCCFTAASSWAAPAPCASRSSAAQAWLAPTSAQHLAAATCHVSIPAEAAAPSRQRRRVVQHVGVEVVAGGCPQLAQHAVHLAPQPQRAAPVVGRPVLAVLSCTVPRRAGATSNREDSHKTGKRRTLSVQTMMWLCPGAVQSSPCWFPQQEEGSPHDRTGCDSHALCASPSARHAGAAHNRKGKQCVTASAQAAAPAAVLRCPAPLKPACHAAAASWRHLHHALVPL